ncbi:MAG TPA: protein kinase, partial [candidate division Zixibacteria bacterium]|nr:protein kinase [candidate division Zixibacteria bacterium]
MIGQTVSHYRILKKIGEGGMGEVYLAEEMSLGHKVALKFLSAGKAAEPESRKRFIHEAKAQAMVVHPNVATFHEVGNEGEKVFIVMEYIEGQKLSERAKTEPLSLAEILALAVQIGEGLQAAHECGVIHRDINPANVLVTARKTAKITDFGLAKWKGASTITRTGLQMGTDHYMSPEQVDGRRPDLRTDIFSFGAVLYELICARPPFEGTNRESIFYEILYTQPQPMARYCRGVPQGLEQAVFKCLAKKPEERYQSAADLVADLKSIKRKVDSGETDFQLERIGRRSLRSILHKISLPLAGVVIALAGLYFIPVIRCLVQGLLGMPCIPSVENLVILPFTNVGGDPANQALCNGLGGVVNNRLSELEKWQTSLRVVPSSDVRDARYDKVYTAEKARKIFGATLAVKGDLEGTGRGVRLTLELIDTKSKSLKPLRVAAADYAMADIAAIPELAVRKLAEMLKIKLTRQAQQALAKGGSSVSPASLPYLQGCGFLQHYENPENLDKTIALFERALRDDPLYGLAYAGLGEAYWRKYQATRDRRWVKLADYNCRRAIQLDKQFVSAHLCLGAIYAGSGHYQNAIEEFKKVLILDSLNVEAYRGLADAYQGLRQNSQAESTYLKAIEVRPNYPIGYSDLAAFYYKRGEFEKSAAQSEQVVKLAPENYTAYSGLGAVFILLGRPSEAKKMFDRSIEIQPNYVKAYNNLGYLYFFEVGQYSDAARQYEKARDIDSSNYLVWGLLASAYYWAPGEQTKAYPAFERAARLAEEKRRANPRDPTLLSDLSVYYGMLGKEGNAL